MLKYKIARQKLFLIPCYYFIIQFIQENSLKMSGGKADKPSQKGSILET